MSKVSGFLLVALAVVAPIGVSAVQPERPNQESFIARAAFSNGRVWVLSDAGRLSYITEGDDRRVEESLPEPAFDLCVLNGKPVVLTGTRDGGTAWTARHLVRQAWSVEATIPTEGDAFLAMDCSAERVTLLTSRRLIDIGGNGQHAVHLSGALSAGSIVTTYGTRELFYVGMNAGEWGGGLRRIDRQTGKITAIERNTTADLCGGPLNSSCDPINGIAAEPWKPGCVVAAVGLIHFEPHGRVVEVCGDTVERLYYRAYGREAPVGRGNEPFSTVAFFGMARDGNALWAVGMDGLYEFGPTGIVRIVPLPRFQEIGGIKVSFALPQFVLVLTNVNQRLSLSGSVPVLIPRR